MDVVIPYVMVIYGVGTALATLAWRLVRAPTEYDKRGSPRSFNQDWLMVAVLGPWHAVAWIANRMRNRKL